MTRVVHCKRNNYDVYIGRGKDPQTGILGKWGNPFKIGMTYQGKVLTREDAIEAYRDWILYPDQGVELQKDLHELRGKILGCWCKPKACHGDILANLANRLEEK
jgi:hypothetical protein